MLPSARSSAVISPPTYWSEVRELFWANRRQYVWVLRAPVESP